jgi:hypothetical protein
MRGSLDTRLSKLEVIRHVQLPSAYISADPLSAEILAAIDASPRNYVIGSTDCTLEEWIAKYCPREVLQ